MVEIIEKIRENILKCFGHVLMKADSKAVERLWK